ncbi:MAG: alpha-2-macroglobulin family protein [Deltaproteobacteria bacterium]|nr:alpha-2-macroglobulin family protein [Deltaproteobacteria bacterium]
MLRLSRIALALALSISVVGCFKDSPWPPETHAIDGLSLDEARITARVEGSTATVSLPLTATKGGTVSGKIVLQLVDLSGEKDTVVGEADRRFSLAGGSERFELALPGVDAGLDREDLARYLIRYEIRSGGETIFGGRDLWVALSKAELILLTPTELAAGQPTFARAFARDPASGRPLEGARLTLTFVDADEVASTLATATTDAEGRANLAIVAPEVIATGTLEALLEAGELTAELRQPLRITRRQTVLLTTDKPRYQPGQTMHLRVLALDGDTRAPAEGREVLFELRDAKGNKVFKQRHTADTYGIAATKVPLADELNFGTWILQATVDGSTAQRELVVERYSLPKFKVTLETDEGYYRPGDRVQGSVSAAYFFGEPVEGQVHLEAQIGAGEAATTLATADGALIDGGFAFDLLLPTSLSVSQAGGAITFAAQVTDTAAQVVDQSATRTLTDGDLAIFAHPEHAPIAGLVTPLIIAVTEPTGAPVVATVDAGTFGTVQTDARGIATLQLPAGSEALLLSLTATHADGRQATTSLALPEPAASGIVVQTDASIYQVGQTLRAQILSVGAPGSVALDLGRGGRALSLTEVALSGGRGSLEIPLTAAHAGALTLDASFPGDGGKMVRGSRTIFVDADDAVAIELTSPARTAPGEATRIDVQVRDAQGAGIPAAVGLAVVDPAVFALGGARPGAEASTLAFGAEVPRSVAGHAASEILSGDAESREAASRLLFAAGPMASAFGIDLNSYRAELAGVKGLASQRFTRTTDDLIEKLQRAAERGLFTEENAARYVPSVAGHTADAYGQPLRTRSSDRWSYRFLGAGPDELFDTADDQERAVDLWTLLYGNGGWGWEDGDAAFDGAAGPTAGGAPAPNARDEGGLGGSAATKVRSYFPETLLVEPALITDASGAASVDLLAADTITTWKIAATASTLDGRVGGGEGDLKVFQDFFIDATLPPTLTREDELEIPVAVYNYLEQDLPVTVTAQPESWYELLSAGTATVTVPAGSVRGVTFRIRALGVGVKGFSVVASGGSVTDAMRRTVLVQPGGEPIDNGLSGRIEPGTVGGSVTFPVTGIAGGNKLSVKIYPGVMAQTVEGMDAILSEPHGCFEQSTSTTWPNVMVAEYMQASGTGSPETMEKAMTFIQKGYQMLVGYESPSGGFNWWGNDEPGNKILTALGILILEDMKSVIEVEQAIIDRHAAWLAAQQAADGSWPKGDALHMGNDFLSEDPATVTAFAIEALSAAGGQEGAVSRGLSYLEGRLASGIDAPFTLAAVSRSLSRAGSSQAGVALASMYEGASVDAEGHFSWSGPGNQSWSGASGSSAGIETTAVAAQAFLAGGSYLDAAEGALGFLAKSKDSLGTWSQTQATVQALRAFTASVRGAGAPAVNGTIEVLVDGIVVGTAIVDPDTSDVVRLLELSEHATPGDHTVELRFAGTGQLMYQVVGLHHLDWGAGRAAGGVAVEVSHGLQTLSVGEVDPVSVTVTNTTASDADQILVKVGLAPGMVPVADDLTAMVQTGRISRFETSATGVVLYLHKLERNASETFSFGAMPTLAGELEAPATEAYGYYMPQEKAVSPPVAFVVTAP